MSLCTKIFHLVQDSQGVSETSQEFNKAPIFSIVCDALYLPKPEKNPQIAREFERVIKKYLWMQKPHLNEKTLLKALEEAQKHFLKNYSKEIKQLKLSVLLIVQTHETDETGTPFFYVLGLGDFKLFKTDRAKTLVFYDPETPQLPLNLTLKKRFNCLTNSIGQGQTRASIQKFSLDAPQSFLLLSYGTYSSIPEDKWIQYSLDFENKRGLLLRSFFRAKERDHLKHLLYINLKETPKHTESLEEENLIEPNPEIKVTSKKTLLALNWFFKIATLLILALCILELTQNTSSRSSRHLHHMLRFTTKEPAMSLSLKNSTPKFFRLPILRERSYLMDLRSRYQRQALVIEKLNDRIKQQDQAIRDMQIKTFKPISPLVQKKKLFAPPPPKE